jgi:putative MATE family efflux protein
MGIDNSIFNEKRVIKVLLRFAIPSIISLLVVELYNMVDTVFVGRYVGVDAIAALTVSFPVQRFLTSIGMLISIGASTFVARSLGSGNINELKDTVINSFVLIIVTLLTVVLGIYIFKNPLITALGASTTVYPLADKYITIILIGSVFQCISMVACYTMTALGITKMTLYSNFIGAVFNIILDILLVKVCGMGVAGAAIATTVSQITAFIFAMYKFNKTTIKFNIKFTLESILKSFNKGLIKGIVTIGFSTFVIEISDAVVSVILNKLLVTTGGDSAIITVGVITKVSMFIFVTIIGISEAMQPIVAYNYGAGNYKKMRETLKVTIKTVTIASLFFGSLLMIFATPIIGFFLKDSSMLGSAVTAFRISIAVHPVIGIYYICIYYYQAIEESKKSFLLSIYRQLVIFIPLAIMFVHMFGIVGAWIAYPVSDMISFVTSLWFIRKGFAQKQKYVIPTSSVKAGIPAVRYN